MVGNPPDSRRFLHCDGQLPDKPRAECLLLDARKSLNQGIADKIVIAQGGADNVLPAAVLTLLKPLY